MNILFLDIDGVLNSTRSCVAFKGYPLNFSAEHLGRFDWVAIGLVRKLCEETGAQIVLSSAWRQNFRAEVVGRELNLPIIDVTPWSSEPETVRGHEIKAWLDQHPEVNQYAIVDDNSDMLPEQIAGGHFVQTNFEDGLTWTNYKALVDVFCRERCKGDMGEHACENRAQCFEPCGALGHDMKHAKVYEGPYANVGTWAD